MHFAKLGYKLAICGRNTVALAETAAHCLEANDKLSADDVITQIHTKLQRFTLQFFIQVLQLVGDMAVEKDCELAVIKTIDQFKKLDVLIPCAGLLTTGPLESISMDEYDNLMNINCRSIVLLIKLCTPHLVETKGNIVNVSSVTGLRAVSICKNNNFLLYGFNLELPYFSVSWSAVLLH